jgi:dTDP-glucose 4,6-dehydratase
MRLLVPGGAGFIGSAYVRRRLEDRPGDRIRVLDKLTYAGRRENLEGLVASGVELVVGDVADAEAVRSAVDGCDAVVNFAAETHVDRSIRAGGDFITTNYLGAVVLLEAARDAAIRLLQVSTDEVYGPIEEGSFTEASPLAPSSPYSAAKAAADLMAAAFVRTYGCDVVICRPANNYGPRQHPEKLIPLCILNALAGDRLPVYGDGRQVRSWLHVTDCCAAIDLVLERGAPGETYNVSGPDELANIDVVRRVLELTGSDEALIEPVADRPGHDRRYSTSSAKLRALGWRAATAFDDGLADTVAWYRENEAWWEPIRTGEYRRWYELHYGRALSAGGGR